MKTKQFTNFTISMTADSKAKKKLSNNVTITIDADNVSVDSKISLRDAHALRKWLDENLPQESKPTAQQ